VPQPSRLSVQSCRRYLPTELQLNDQDIERLRDELYELVYFLAAAGQPDRREAHN
jgi:hypothetical protein